MTKDPHKRPEKIKTSERGRGGLRYMVAAVALMGEGR